MQMDAIFRFLFLFITFFVVTQSQAILTTHPHLQTPLFTKNSFSLKGGSDTVGIVYPNNILGLRLREDDSVTGILNQNGENFIDSSPIQAHISNGGTKSIRLGRQILKEEQQNTILLTNPQQKKDLIIDPMVYSSYFTGSEIDIVKTFSVGNGSDSYTIIMAGTTNSPDFPTKNQISNVATPDTLDNFAFITRFDSNGNIIFSTYFGGTLGNKDTKIQSTIEPFHTERDSVGNLWIVGKTSTPDIPLTQNGFQTELFDVLEVGFVLSLNNMGNSIMYSSLLGGEKYSYTRLSAAKSLITDTARYLVLGGSTNCTEEIIIKNPLQERGDEQSLFFLYVGAFKILTNETKLLFGTIFGGENEDRLEDLVTYTSSEDTIDIWATGSTNSTEFFKKYDETVSPHVHFIDKSINIVTHTVYFLKITLTKDDNTGEFTPELKSASFLGGEYEDRAYWIQSNHGEYQKTSYYNGSIFISGFTKNYDTFQGDPIKSEWMKTTPNNDGNSQVGFLVELDVTGTKINFALLTGCKDKETSIFYNYPHPINSIFISGYTNCIEDEYEMTNSIWDEILPETNNITQFEYKYFMMNLDLTPIDIHGSDASLDDLIYYSTFVDGVSYHENIAQYSAIKTDITGNIYSIFNIPGDTYQNQYNTDNSFMNHPSGPVSVLLRVYGHYSCNPGSILYDTNLCQLCPQGKFSNKSNSASCYLCKENTYQNQVGKTNCFDCPNGKSSKEGQTECNSKNAPKQPSISTYDITENSLSIKWIKEPSPLDFQIALLSPTGMEIQTVVLDPAVNSTDQGDYYYIVISGLEASSRYFIRLRPTFNTNWTFGSWSSDVTASTISPPNRVHSKDMTVDPHPTSIDLTWEPANDPSGCQVTYRILYYSNDDPDQENTEILSEYNNVTLTNLEIRKNYTVTIIPINDAGEGFSSTPITVSTRATIPDQVSPTSKQDTDSIELNWEEPNNNGYNITEYSYFCKQINPNKRIIIGDQSITSLTLTDLNPNTTYEITINARNYIGLSLDNFNTYETKNKAKDDSFRNAIIGLSIGGGGIFFLVITVLLFLARNRIIKGKKRRDLRILRRTYKKNWRKKLDKELLSSNDTLYFDNINEKEVFDYFYQQFRLGHYIKKKQNWFIAKRELRNGLAFCKLASMLEVEIHRKLWKQWSLNPRNTPLVQFYISIPVDKELAQRVEEGISLDVHKFKKKLRKKNINGSLSDGNSSQSESNLGDTSFGASGQDDFGFSSGFESVKESESEAPLIEKNKNKKISKKNTNQKILLILEYMPFTLDWCIKYRNKNKMYFTNNEKIWIAYSLLNNLKFIHNNSIIHRDVKPQNIVISNDGIPRLTDFSCAIELKENSEQIYDKYVGTKPYFDPELQPEEENEDVQNLFPYTFAHDIYALGVTLEKLNKDNTGMVDNQENELESMFLQIIQFCKFPMENRPSTDELINILKPYLKNL
ncbi:mitogen-activated protein kinase kinase kinase 20-related [Anaeramoeba flamelloides]|uniref:Mitogen-activated protein kinase kinase kinase 20-related n=1 Tax=Anaeramoeba flamelloides TaxID=1746091 RepID=A0AAV7Z4E1_9EUKA|nr:mitogen-activated protein kinase kinase kinase 20-related [Anaeramoeba flamelloides]